MRNRLTICLSLSILFHIFIIVGTGMMPGLPRYRIKKYTDFITKSISSKKSDSSHTVSQRQYKRTITLLSSSTQRDEDETEKTISNLTSPKYSSKSSESLVSKSDQVPSNSEEIDTVLSSANSTERLESKETASSDKRVIGERNSEAISNKDKTSEPQEKIVTTEKKLRIKFFSNLFRKESKKADVVFVFGFPQLSVLPEDVNIILRSYFSNLTENKIDYRLGFVRFIDSEGHKFEFSKPIENWLVFKGRLTYPPEKQQTAEKSMSPLDLLMNTLKEFDFRKNAMRRLVFFTKVKFGSDSSSVPNSRYTVDEIISACIKKDIMVDVYSPEDDIVHRLASQTGGKWSQWKVR